MNERGPIASDSADPGDRLLRNVLRVDAALSALSMVALIGAARPIARGMGVSAGIVLGIGIAFIPWTVTLVGAARRARPDRRVARFVVGGNTVWVIATVVVLAGFPDAVTTGGKWLLVVVALGAADLAAVEWIGLRRLGRGGDVAV